MSWPSINFSKCILEESFDYLIVLNQRIDTPFFPCLWSNASNKICADGGYTRLIDYSQSKHPLFYLPNYIVGDMDSISPDTLNIAREKNIEIITNLDQNTNDFQKSINLIESLQNSSTSHPLNIAVIGALGGRFDHTAASISILHKFPHHHIWLVDNTTIVTLIPAGKHEIHINKEIEGIVCGIIPFAGPATVTTSGLQWNLNNQILSMESLISTSNKIVDQIVTIMSNSSLIWTTHRQE